MKIILIFFLLALTSCATVFNKRNYNLNISSSKFGDKIKFENKVYDLPAKLNVQRSRNDLSFKLLSDSSEVDYVIKSSINSEFLYGNLIWFHFSPIAYLIDLRSQKRFFYERSIYINRLDSSHVIIPRLRSKYEPYFSKQYLKSKGEIDLVVSIPYVNNFYYKPLYKSDKSSTGFFGISSGINYYFKDSEFLNVSLSAITNSEVPFPVAVDYEGSYERFISFSINLTRNINLRRFHFGYGLNYSRNNWKLIDDSIDATKRILDDRVNNSLGLTINAYHQFTNDFSLGLIYQPSLLRLNHQLIFNYEHVLSLDLSFKVNIKK